MTRLHLFNVCGMAGDIFFVSNFKLLTYDLAYCSKSSSNRLYVLA